MGFLHEEDDHNHTDEKKLRVWRRGQILVGTSKGTGELIILAKFGGHALHHLASRLTNVIRQGGRQAGRQTKNLVLVIFF